MLQLIVEQFETHGTSVPLDESSAKMVSQKSGSFVRAQVDLRRTCDPRQISMSEDRSPRKIVLLVVPLPKDTHAASISIIGSEDLLRVNPAYLNRIAETIFFHGM
jgi:hypothetical protein